MERKDLDAVIIATPEHWHAPAALMAMKAGKKINVATATGMQRRSWPDVIKAVQEVKEHMDEIGNTRSVLHIMEGKEHARYDMIRNEKINEIAKFLYEILHCHEVDG